MCFLLPTLGYEVGHSHDCNIEWGSKCVATVFLLCCVYKLFLCVFLIFLFKFFRVHGSYEQLWAGQVADALVDLTGGIAERWTLKGPGKNVEKEKTGMVLEKAVFRRLMNLKEQCVISCSVLNSRQGDSKCLY